MDENDILKPKAVDKGAHIIVTQVICVAIILISIVVVKYFFKGCYSSLKKWYTDNICTETSVSEVVETIVGEVDEV